VREINAKAAKLEAEAGAASQGIGMQVNAATSDELERVTDELRKAQTQLADETLRINKDADTRLEVARIEAASREEVARIQAASDERLARIEAFMQRAAEKDAPSMAGSKTKPKE
jgi:hypothetical protein